MPDSRISDLVSVSQMDGTELLVLEQGGVAKSISAVSLISGLAQLIDENVYTSNESISDYTVPIFGHVSESGNSVVITVPLPKTVAIHNAQIIISELISNICTCSGNYLCGSADTDILEYIEYDDLTSSSIIIEFNVAPNWSVQANTPVAGTVTLSCSLYSHNPTPPTPKI